MSTLTFMPVVLELDRIARPEAAILKTMRWKTTRHAKDPRFEHTERKNSLRVSPHTVLYTRIQREAVLKEIRHRKDNKDLTGQMGR
ncbi:hypothetical protein ElyMa_000573900 [Elysia marginata]|uniref:Uncharacterized protein n=1 Tax=Elysia marginata TaxID=1093978 RepID=A0AAV4G3R9_9GAST|nr:hypothetical protein ElyMa_000573900 [Elysia marginata]